MCRISDLDQNHRICKSEADPLIHKEMLATIANLIPTLVVLTHSLCAIQVLLLKI